MEESEIKYFDFGEIAIKDCDGSNIPVNCFICEPEEDEYWTWFADNFMPRKNHSSEGMYKIKATTKAELLKAVNKYVVPLYWTAVNNLIKSSKNYYWENSEAKA